MSQGHFAVADEMLLIQSADWDIRFKRGACLAIPNAGVPCAEVCIQRDFSDPGL